MAADGLDPALLPRGTAAAYVTPSHQYPLGARMPVTRRVQLLEWAARTGGTDAELLELLAARPAESVRVVQAQLQRVLNAAEARQEPATAALAREILDGITPPAPAPRRMAGTGRTSGIVAPSAAAARSREKMVWEWPDIGERTLEEWR